jgi:hypothetical protein
MSIEKNDRVSFYVRKDFGEENTIYTRTIARGDDIAVKYYICKFMTTTHGSGKERLGQLSIQCPFVKGAFVFT